MICLHMPGADARHQLESTSQKGRRTDMQFARALGLLLSTSAEQEPVQNKLSERQVPLSTQSMANNGWTRMNNKRFKNMKK